MDAEEDGALNHHHIHPLDTDRMFVVQMGRPDQNVSLTQFVMARELRDGPGEDPRDGVLGGDTANTGNC